jgi:hypothetical protein
VDPIVTIRRRGGTNPNPNPNPNLSLLMRMKSKILKMILFHLGLTIFLIQTHSRSYIWQGMNISKTNFVNYATSLGIFLAMSFRLALLLSHLSNSTSMTPNGESHVIELLLDPNRLRIKLTSYVNSRNLKSRGSLRSRMRLITAKSSWFLNLMELNACA